MTLTSQELFYSIGENGRYLEIALEALVAPGLTYGTDNLWCMIESGFYSLPAPRHGSPGRKYTCADGDCGGQAHKAGWATPSPSVKLEVAAARLTLGADVLSSIKFVVTLPEVIVDVKLMFRNLQGAGSIKYNGAVAATLPSGITCDGLSAGQPAVVSSAANEQTVNFGTCSPTMRSTNVAPKSVVVELLFVPWDTALDNVGNDASTVSLDVSFVTSGKAITSTAEVVVDIAVPKLKVSLSRPPGSGSAVLFAGQAVPMTVTVTHDALSAAVGAYDLVVNVSFGHGLSVAGASDWSLPGPLAFGSTPMVRDFEATVDAALILGSAPIAVTYSVDWSSSGDSVAARTGVERSFVAKAGFPTVAGCTVVWRLVSTSDAYTEPASSVTLQESAMCVV